MKLTIIPSKAHGTAAAPPSKSMAHRLLMCAALASCGSGDPGTYDQKNRIFRIGGCSISNLDISDDIKATLNCIKALSLLAPCGTGIVTGDNEPSSGTLPAVFDCGESGSTLRFFIPTALLFDKDAVFKGSGRLLERPLGIYEDICEKQGIIFSKDSGSVRVKGKLSPGEYIIPGNISSQFISGLLFALPLLEDDSIIKLIPPVESRPYIDMTIRALSLFNINVSFRDDLTICVPGRQKYASRNLTVEGDYSNAAFLDAFNLAGGSVNVTGLDPGSLQGDKVYGSLFNKLGSPESVIDISDCPDLGPVLIASAAIMYGAVFTGTGRLALKESDRGRAMKEELLKFGKEIIINENSITVPTGDLHCPEEVLYGHNDHRIVMALTLPASIYGGTIDGCEAVNKSFPDYFEKLTALGINIIKH